MGDLISRPFPLVLISNFLLSQKFSTKLLASSTLVFALASYTRAHVKLEKINKQLLPFGKKGKLIADYEAGYDSV